MAFHVVAMQNPEDITVQPLVALSLSDAEYCSNRSMLSIPDDGTSSLPVS